ncbi:hypothetical protein EVAR_98942_1 [Eumeta japonica]|uniref:Uncharacterized protein n=1 Tax=Eumeta variegata TaxID=151549 RepID=A0A4C1SQS8_EUMVA|nr:hypothetical protein EVAR_98942_1 [Eumeta japonica]
MDRGGSGEVGTTQQRDVRHGCLLPVGSKRQRSGSKDHCWRSPFVQTFDSNSKGYPTDDALVGCYVLGRHSGRSADLKVKMKHCFTLCCRSGLYGVKWRRSHD